MIKPRRMRWGEGGKNHTKFWLGKPDGKILLERPKRRWEETIK
jgi:hypothetical protein